MPREISRVAAMATSSHRSNPYPPSKPVGGSGKPAFLSLKSSMSNSIVEDNDVVVIRDKYPKAKFHFLILPKSHHDHDALTSVSSFTPDHLHLVEHMMKVAGDLMQREAPGVLFQAGFHSIPSMTPLHMHVISKDFDSPCLKNKKHWNTFATEFFVPTQNIVEKLKTDGKIVVNRQKCEEIMKRDLACRWCNGKQFKTIPDLKKHLLTTEHKNNLLKTP